MQPMPVQHSELLVQESPAGLHAAQELLVQAPEQHWESRVQARAVALQVEQIPSEQ